MQKPLSNVSYHSYQDYQPTRRYGPQYEPGGYASAVQQRTNMTQREDALKFEQGRIKALQEERLHIQKKTFTKWINSFLQKARMEVEDLFADLADGRRLLKLLEIISGERLPRPNSGRMRVHKIENVNKSLSFLHTKVRLESIGAEDIVDGNPRLILGLIWTIILRFQIQEIEIDVDEENESSEKKSAKDALLLWCQRKTNGYHGVHIHNFTDSWRSGLGFNALIHAHRPDLFRWAEVPASDHVETLNHAFDVAHKHLGIPRLLDAEDVDTSRPDEKSVMTYVASYYHTFARMKNEQKSGRRIANIIGQLMDCDARKSEYSQLMTALLEWIRLKVQQLDDRALPNSLDGIQRLLLAFKQYRTVEKPPKYKERSEIEALYFSINTMQKALVGEPWAPPDGHLPQDLQRAWLTLEQAEHAREIALRTELLRQQRLEQLNYKFNTKSVLRKGYLKEMIQVLSDPRYGSNLAQVDATVKKHEAISADILARTERFEDLSAMAAELVRENYHGAEAAARTEKAVLQRWRELLELLERHRVALAALANLTALLREADTVASTLAEMQAQFQSEEVGRHLVDVERLLQAHALQELQLGALHDGIQRLARLGAAATGPAAPKGQLHDQLQLLQDEYGSLVAAAKDRKARLEDARNLYQFLEDHDEEEGWVTEKQRICQAEVAAKDLRAALALRQKHAALLHEIRARQHVATRHRHRGRSLIDAKHPKSAEIERKLSSLEEQWNTLQELAAQREKQLADAAEAHQFYGDANEAESWMKEKRALVASDDCGRDEHAAQAQLARQRLLRGELTAQRPERATLRAAAARLRAAGIHTLQLPTEVESTPAMEKEEWVNESRLVPTEVWEEEPVERLEHRTVTEERTVPQVKALYAFSGQGISMAKGEVMFLLSRTNPDWWSVRKADRTDGFVPANYVREIEPRVVPVQVRRPEKVRTVQRVKKTVLVKQVVPVKKSRPQPARRVSRAVPGEPALTVEETVNRLDERYEELLKLSESRQAQLEDAIQLYSFFAECDDFEKWMREKEKLLRAEDDQESVDTARRKYEKFVTDLSAASRRLEGVEESARRLAAARHPQAARAAARHRALAQHWDTLLRLKQQKEKSLEGASSVELFGRTCDEALAWMSEKEQQLCSDANAPQDLRTVRALQRRHAQLERELEPLRQKVATVTLLAKDVKSQYPTERANVEARQQQIAEAWEQTQAQAADRRQRLENAVGLQVLARSAATLHAWLQDVQEQLATEGSAKDVATAEGLLKQHQDLGDDIKAHQDEFKEVIGLGRQLLANNPSLTDVAEKVKNLEDEQNAVEQRWAEKERQLTQLVQLAAFTREADQVDASSGATQACLDLQHSGASSDEAEAMLKRHEEVEARLAAQDERLAGLCSRAETLQRDGHYASPQIQGRCEAVVQKREAVRQAVAERRRALMASAAYYQFIDAVDELETWIQDKTRTAKDQSYRDLVNLERKLQKHEAFESELQANEKQLRNVESIGQSLQSSEAGERLRALQGRWAALQAASRDKGGKLRQAAAQKHHRRSVEDAKARLADLERALKSEELGSDLRSCKRLMAQHQSAEQEVSQWERRVETLVAAGDDLASAGHFDADNIRRECELLAASLRALGPLAARRRRALDTRLQFHKFSAEVSAEWSWLAEQRLALGAAAALKQHAKLRAALAHRRPLVQRLLARGTELGDQGHPDADQIGEMCSALEREFEGVWEACQAAGARLEAASEARQFAADAHELEAQLADRAAALRDGDLGRDAHQATRLLTRHKAVELELDTYAAIVAEMGHAAASMAGAGHPAGEELLQRHEALQDALQALQRLAARRQRALVDSVCRHEYLAESAELESWIQEQHAAAASEDYGQDLEHLLILQSKFDKLRLCVESGAERFNQCEELAKKLLASDSPYILDIEKRQEDLGAAWQRLVEQIAARRRRLAAAGDIHRFHRDVAELLARAGQRRARLAAAPAARLDADLLDLAAQIQVLQEEGSRLTKLYPGNNAQQIALQQRALSEAWEALQSAADDRRRVLSEQAELQRFLQQARAVTSWCAATCAALGEGGARGVRDAAAAQAARADHEALRPDLEARQADAAAALRLGQRLVADHHPGAREVEEKCVQVAEWCSRAGAAWASRLVALDQLLDLHCFLRDCGALHALCAARERALAVEIPADCSVEEVDNLLKKHEAFEKLLVTQDEKLQTLQSHGAKLLEQNHVESQRIADELAEIVQRTQKVSVAADERRAVLVRRAKRARFARDAADARAWAQDKLAALSADHALGEVTNLEDKIKKLQKHQAFTAELAANSARLQELEVLAEQLRPDEEVDREMAALTHIWEQLQATTDERGRGLEEAQDILEFNQQLDKIEAWIRDKEMMVVAHELGRDYEHCSSLLRKLDDLDSDMKVDDGRVKRVCALAQQLLRQGGTQQAAGVAARRDALLHKWRALSGALAEYRAGLAAALEVHSFHRDVEDTEERIAKKAAVFGSTERGRELSAAHELMRRHRAREAEAQAVGDRILHLTGEGRDLQRRHPDREKEIESSLQSLQEGWQKLQQLAAKRTVLLEEAIAEHKFDENLKELEEWVSEAVSRMEAAEPPDSVAAAAALLELHHERKAEIDGRQKAIAALQKEVEQYPEKQQKLALLSKTLDEAWLHRKQSLTEAHQLQLLKEQARAAEDWLAAKEAFLNNDDLGDDLDAVETLIRKHQEFSKLLESQLGRVGELETFARGLLTDGHGDAEYIQKRLDEILARAEKLKESCERRGSRLQQSRQLLQLLHDLQQERDWIARKEQFAADDSYRELSNLQSKLQKQTAFEAELAANKGRIDAVASKGEELIEAGHYAGAEVSRQLEQLEAAWRRLQRAAAQRRRRLQQALQARVFLRSLDDHTAWLHDVEAQLLSEDHGQDLRSTQALLAKHARLEQQVAAKREEPARLADTAAALAADDHFLADQLLAAADAAQTRYRQLQEPMQIRRDNLEDAEQLHRWDRDADEELAWLKEREPAVLSEDVGSTLAEAQALHKKHIAIEAEIAAREPTVKAVCGRAGQLSRRGHFAAAALEARGRALLAALAALHDAARAKAARVRDRCDLLQFMSEVSEAEAWIAERRAAAAGEAGRDEESARALLRRLEALQASLQALDASLQRLQTTAESRWASEEAVVQRLGNLRTSYDELTLLCAQRHRRLQQSLQYFKFATECASAAEWMGEQMSAAASEDYGRDVEHVEALQQAFSAFLLQLNANEGRIEAACELGAALLEEGAPEEEKIKSRIADLRGLWEDLKELALARQEALAGARQVHEFDRRAEESAAWVEEKAAGLRADGAPPRSLHELHARRRDLHALRDDLGALHDAHAQLAEEADRLGAAFPDAREHVSSKLEDVTEALRALSTAADERTRQLELAGQLQAYFGTYQELLAWLNETQARVTAPELGRDVAEARRLLDRHRELCAEIAAKDDLFRRHYDDGEKLIREGHFMSAEIAERTRTLQARRQQLGETCDARGRIYRTHLDALAFLNDAAALDAWIATRVPLVRDGQYGESLSQVEQLINRHQDLEGTIESQKEKVRALQRTTLIEQEFAAQREKEEAARKRTAELQEEQRLGAGRRRELSRIAEPEESQEGGEEETVSPAPQFDLLPKPEPQVKRAESMSVVKTPKRTPSFTTRRRTQSFRRHRGQEAELPPVEIEGFLERKQEAGCGGKRATVRSWRSYYAVLCGQLLCFFKDELDFTSSKAAAPPVAILNARCEIAGDYRKRAHVFRLSCGDGAEYLFSCGGAAQLKEWVAKIAFHAELPPALQLTPYGRAPEPDAELRRRLHQSSSSSSGASSPEPSAAPRSQADILNQHRNSQQQANIESAVLPSLPPRQPPTQEEEVIMRNAEKSPSAWGRSRFSNGRDFNTEFIRSQQNADAPPLPLSGPPERSSASERPPALPERGPTLPERGPTLSERGQTLPERGPALPERGPKLAERPEKSVHALVSNYQRMTAPPPPRDANRNTWDAHAHAQHRQNNNWHSVETTSHFYAANELAYGGNSGGRPASVAGSGGSPALDQRPASRSSGESELSVSGVSKDKKDKKGVFGGLFSRKKRPQSHM